MGKGLIVDGGEEGLYTVLIVYDKSKVNSRLAEVAERFSLIDLEIADFEDELELQEGLRDTINASLQAAINAIDTGKDYKEQYKGISALLKELYVIAEEIRQIEKDITFLESEKLSLTLEENRLKAVPDSITESFWCADFTEDLTSYVGLISIPGDLDVRDGSASTHMNVLAGYDGWASYVQERDGVIRRPEGDVPAGVTANWALQPGWEKWHPRYRIAELTDIDHAANTGDLTIEPLYSNREGYDLNYRREYTEIPFRYMTCNSRAFEIGDRILVEFENMEFREAERNWYKSFPSSQGDGGSGGSGSGGGSIDSIEGPPRIFIIGFAEKPRRCCDAELASINKDLLPTAYIYTDPPADPPLTVSIRPNYGNIDWAGRNCKRVLTWEGPPVRYATPANAEWTTSDLYASTVEWLCESELQEYQKVSTPNGWYVLGAGSDSPNQFEILLLEFGYPNGAARIWAYRLTPTGGDPANGYDVETLATLDGWEPDQMAFFHPDGQYCIFLGHEEVPLGDPISPGQIITFDARNKRFNIEYVSSGSGTRTWSTQATDGGLSHYYDSSESYSWSGIVAIDYSPQGDRVWIEMSYSSSETISTSNPDGVSTDYSITENRNWSFRAAGADTGLPDLPSGSYSYSLTSGAAEEGERDQFLTDTEKQEYIRFVGLDLRYGKAIWIDHYHLDSRTTIGNHVTTGAANLNGSMTTILQLVEDGSSVYTDSSSISADYGDPIAPIGTLHHKDRSLELQENIGGFSSGCQTPDNLECSDGDTEVYSPWNPSLPYYPPTYPIATTLGAVGNDWPGRLAMTPKGGFLWSFALDNLDDNTFDTTHRTKLSYGDFADWGIYGWHKVDGIGLAMLIDGREMGETP